MEQDPWEDLDIDDSDLPSILRPCKGHHSPSPAVSKDPPEDLRLHEQQLSASKSVSSNRTIPGPAGTVLAAMIRKSLDREDQSFVSLLENRENFNDRENNIMLTPTQEYIRRAIEDTVEFDDDFTRSPWLSALRFLGAEDGMIPGTPINCMKKRFEAAKVNQVVAVIKSCLPNGHGGLIVTLKDPTGTIGATVHPKVLSKSEVRKILGVGAVLVLQKVAIFSPVSTTHYLNITLGNLVKVFGQSSRAPANHNDPGYLIEYNNPGFENGRSEKTLEKLPIMQKVIVESSTGTGSVEDSQNHNLTQKHNLYAKSFKSSDDIIRTETRITFEEHDHVSGSEKYANAEKHNGGILNNNCTATKEIQETTDSQVQRQYFIEKSAVPQWTDEQLDELFMDDDYKISMY